MPKIIQNLKELLLAEAKRQIAERGYVKTTIRSIANALEVGVGTVYNYFPSKDMLIASFLLEDWKTALSNMQKLSCDDLPIVLKAVYDELTSFMRRHASLFSDKEATASYWGAFHERHGLLRSQIAKILAPACRVSPVEDKNFLAEFVAESLLVWTVAKKDFEEILQIVQLLVRKK